MGLRNTMGVMDTYSGYTVPKTNEKGEIIYISDPITGEQRPMTKRLLPDKAIEALKDDQREVIQKLIEAKRALEELERSEMGSKEYEQKVWKAWSALTEAAGLSKEKNKKAESRIAKHYNEYLQNEEIKQGKRTKLGVFFERYGLIIADGAVICLGVLGTVATVATLGTTSPILTAVETAYWTARTGMSAAEDYLMHGKFTLEGTGVAALTVVPIYGRAASQLLRGMGLVESEYLIRVLTYGSGTGLAIWGGLTAGEAIYDAFRYGLTSEDLQNIVSAGVPLVVGVSQPITYRWMLEKAPNEFMRVLEYAKKLPKELREQVERNVRFIIKHGFPREWRAYYAAVIKELEWLGVVGPDAERLASWLLLYESSGNATIGHSLRVYKYLQSFMKDYPELFKGTAQEIREILIAALLHDIGKDGVEFSYLAHKGKAFEKLVDAIRKKYPDKPEWEIDKLVNQEIPRIITPQHINPIILRTVFPESPEVVEHGVRYHHENWIGDGPNKLAGEMIPFIGRLLRFFDTIEAMSDNRKYQKSRPLEKIMDVLNSQQFDPSLRLYVMEWLNKNRGMIGPK